MVPFTRMMIGVLTLARVQSAVLSCVPVLTVTVEPPAPPVVLRPKPTGEPLGAGVGVGVGAVFTVIVWAWVERVPQLFV